MLRFDCNMLHGRTILRIIFYACLGFKTAAMAETSDFNIRLWQAEDGLPHNIVQTITQTRDGYLWLGTREGLARFDGEHFQAVDLVPGSTPPSIFGLLESKDGSVWVGTDGAGLFRLHDGEVDRCILPDGTRDFQVFQIQEGSDGGVWIAIPHQILRWMNGKFERRAEFRNVRQAFCADKDGQVWLLDDQLKRLDTTAATNCVLKTGLLPRFARSLYRDNDGVFWIGADSRGGNSLIKFADGAATSYRRAVGSAGYASVIFRDSAGELWVGSYSGLSRFANGEFVNLGAPDEPSYRIYAIYQDQEQNLWVGSEEGLARFTPKKFKTLLKKDGLAGNTVVTVCPSRDGSVWISSWSEGLNHLENGKITILTKTNGISSNFIMGMTEGRDGSLWAGTDYGGGLNRLKDGNVTTYGQEQGLAVNATTAITAVFEDDQEHLWIGARDTLQCWDGQKFTAFPEIANRMINALCGGTAGVVWIGTREGLVRWRAGLFEDISANNAQLKVSILSLYEDKANTLWIGTRGRGLLRLKNGVLAEFAKDRGLFNNSLYSILEDGRSNLWLNSSAGIFRVDKNELEAVACGKKSDFTSISYGKADGILISGQYQDVTQPAACKSVDGRLWFRTTQGVAVVDPDKISSNRRPPPVVIQEIIADKKPLGNLQTTGESQGKIIVQPGRGEVEIHYAALSFSAPEKNQFRYRLQNEDLSWVDAGTRRVAFYNNLRPGQYHFQVTACNNDGVWNDTGASVTLQFKPHFWQTTWFLVVAGMALIGVVSGSARYITRRRLQRKLERLEHQNALEKERARIARDMHDELGAKLTSISFQGAMARRRLSNPAEAERQIDRMSETARELVLSLDQIVWAVDPKNDTLENLATYVCRYASEFLENSQLRCEFMIPTKLPDYRLSTEVRHNVFLAVKEVLNNAVKHADANRVTLKLMVRTEEFEINIADDGRGIAAEESEAGRIKRTGHGLTNLKERLSSIHGRFELNTEAGHGLEVRLIVPLQESAETVSSIYPTRNGMK